MIDSQETALALIEELFKNGVISRKIYDCAAKKCSVKSDKNKAVQPRT